MPIGIQCQMQFAPAAVGFGAMFLLPPLAPAIDFKTGAIDNNMHRPVRWTLPIRSVVGQESWLGLSEQFAALR